MKVALVHDDLIQWGGAERLFLGIAEVFPQAPIYTSIFDSAHPILQEKFGKRDIRTSFLQKIPRFKNLYKLLLPLYPAAFEQFDFSEFDIVVSSSSRFAKSIITKPSTIHICYCHTPPRFLWNLSGQKTPILLSLFLSLLRVYDQLSAHRVDVWIANSHHVKQRIKKIYGQDSAVLYPFVNLNDFKHSASQDGDYYLIMARLTQYKRVDLAIEVFNKLGKPLTVVGIGPEASPLKQKSKKNIQFLDFVSDEKRLELLASCKALIITAEEDFGITSIEAQALGKPVIAFARGGARETVIDKQTGVFFPDQTADSLEQAILEFERLRIDPLVCRENAKRFSQARFAEDLKQIVTKDLSAIPL